MKRRDRPEPIPNPWGLTPCECAALDAVIRHGGYKMAGFALGLSPKTVHMQLAKARERMGERTRLLTLIAWDRHAREAT